MKKCTTMLVVLLGMAFLVEGLSVNKMKVHKRMAVSKGDTRAEKRDLLQFASMIKCATNKNALKFIDYGNYCGWGGEGKPVDEVDRCCKIHDECYGRNDECGPKLLEYKYTMKGKHPSCKISCSLNVDKCKRAVCRCDKLAAECFAKYRYNPKHNQSWF